MYDIDLWEFEAFCNDVVEYSQECEYNYNECVNTIMESNDLYCEEKLAYLNEQAEEKQEKGIVAIVRKFTEFIQKILDKIKDAFDKCRIGAATKVINADDKLKQLRVTAPDPKKFDRFIQMRYRATDNVIKKLRRKKMCVTKAEFDAMIDQEFSKINSRKSAIVGGAITLGLTALSTWAWNVLSKKMIETTSKQYKEEVEELYNNSVKVAYDYEEKLTKTNTLDEHKKVREDYDNFKKQLGYAAGNLKQRRDSELTKMAEAKKKGTGRIISGGLMSAGAISTILLRHVAETASYQEQYLSAAFKIINKASLSKANSVNIVDNKKVYNFTKESYDERLSELLMNCDLDEVLY